MKTTVIYHSADYDGLFCREIARKFLPDAELIGWDFKDPKIPFPSEGTVYILDLSPDCIFEQSPIDSQRLIWIDHHKSSIEKWTPDIMACVIPGYRIDGVAACRLAWQWFAESMATSPDTGEPIRRDVLASPNYLPPKQDYIDRKVSEPLAVRLAGEYDIWDKRDPRSETFQYGLRSRELSDCDWRQMLSTEKPSIDEVEKLIETGFDKHLLEPDGTFVGAIVGGLLEVGGHLEKYAHKENESLVKYRSYLLQWEGLKFLTLNTARCNSITFAAKDVPETGHDALLGYYFDGKGWNVSLYHAKHRTDLDLSAVAVKRGGGGHQGACGFRCEYPPFLPAPGSGCAVA